MLHSYTLILLRLYGKDFLLFLSGIERLQSERSRNKDGLHESEQLRQKEVCNLIIYLQIIDHHSAGCKCFVTVNFGCCWYCRFMSYL